MTEYLENLEVLLRVSEFRLSFKTYRVQARQIRSGEISSDQVGSDPVRSDRVSSGQVGQVIFYLD